MLIILWNETAFGPSPDSYNILQAQYGNFQ